MMYDFYKEIPEGFLTYTTEKLYEAYQRPILIHLEGDRKEPIFISTLLHGNETTGFYALQRFLQECNGLGRSLIIFIGNTRAASQGQRHLNDQPDYNRIWASGNSKEHIMARSVFKYARDHQVVCSIDLHNNTGRNPYYSCINKLEKKFINLATLFSDKTIYFTEPHEVQSNCFANICPSLTIEAGIPGEEAGIVYVTEFLNKLVSHSCTSDFLETSYCNADFYHSVARIKIPEDVVHDYKLEATSDNALSFAEDFDLLNFTCIDPGSIFGHYHNEDSRLVVIDSYDKVVTGRFFQFRNGKVITKVPIIPSMFTKDVKIAKEDCLGYIMDRLEIPLD
jgi:succinylglutamate desuccinylase